MQVQQLWQYPVKSMIGQRVSSAQFDAAGMRGDRAWALRDEERGGIRGAKKIGELMKLSASCDDSGAVSIGLPDGTTVSATADDVHQRLSAALDHRVSLWPLQPATDVDHYRRGPADSDDMMVELNSIFGREEGEPLPDFSIFPPEILEFESPPGTYLDAFPLMVMSTASLEALAAALPHSAIDVRRFRPNIVIDVGDETGHPEFDWVGRRASIGDAEVEFVAACPRCVMVTRQVTDAIPADRAILRHIVRDLGQNVGVYATVAKPGIVAEGSPVRFI